jgi:hypothetical protein
MLDSIPENSRNIQNTTFPQNAKSMVLQMCVNKQAAQSIHQLNNTFHYRNTGSSRRTDLREVTKYISAINTFYSV